MILEDTVFGLGMIGGWTLALAMVHFEESWIIAGLAALGAVGTVGMYATGYRSKFGGIDDEG